MQYLIVKNQIIIPKKYLTQDQEHTICKELTVLDPLFMKLKKMGKFHSDPFIRLYRSNDNYLFVPRGLIDKVKSLLPEPKVYDNTVVCDLIEVEYNNEFPPFGYQQRCIDNALADTQGLIFAPPGSGKSIMALNIVSKLKQPTLIIVNTSELKKQWNEYISKYLKLNFSTGLIGEGLFEVGKITIAMFQSLMNFTPKEWEEINKQFGCVFVDEVAHLPANKLYGIINRLAARYRYGLTAAIERKDQREFMTFAALGDKISQVTIQDLIEAGRYVQPKAVFLKDANVDYQYDDSWNALLDVLISNQQRNQFIVSQIRIALKDNRTILVLSERIEHCEELYSQFKELPEAVLFVGKIESKARDVIRNSIRDGKTKLVFATRHLSGEALDLPPLDMLFLVTPSNNASLLKQMVGRICRVFEGKKSPVVCDVVDTNVSICKSLARRRKKFYTKMLLEVYNGKF